MEGILSPQLGVPELERELLGAGVTVAVRDMLVGRRED